ncbi:hypothetical protein [Agrococcus sp. SGAir0287]|uniref:hypothetical protein n=1 Tax=Agrococcus sp. SGAir0287 TaxID=2070347 RepID=UPI0010F952F2|nr:hypothetical protein [Agrococcus sp. SGAir0287]
MTETNPTAPDPDLLTDPDTAEPAPEAPDLDRPSDPGTPGPAEPEQPIPDVSPAPTDGAVTSELDGPPELDRVVEEQPEPTSDAD